MTREEADVILSHIAQNFISPLCFDKREARDIYLEYSGEKFNELVSLVFGMVEREEKKNDARRTDE